MNNMSFDILRSEPTRQPKAVTASFVGNRDACDIASSPYRFIAPTMQQLQQCILVNIELLQWLTLDARNDAGDEPARLTHLNNCDKRGIWVQRDEASAKVVPLRHELLHYWVRDSERQMQSSRRSPHSISLNRACRDHCPGVSATLTTTAFDRSSLRWLGISDLIAEPEGPTSISHKVARRRMDGRRS